LRRFGDIGSKLVTKNHVYGGQLDSPKNRKVPGQETTSKITEPRKGESSYDREWRYGGGLPREETVTAQGHGREGHMCSPGDRTGAKIGTVKEKKLAPAQGQERKRVDVKLSAWSNRQGVLLNILQQKKKEKIRRKKRCANKGERKWGK